MCSLTGLEILLLFVMMASEQLMIFVDQARHVIF
jgi:hypothetical protein